VVQPLAGANATTAPGIDPEALAQPVREAAGLVDALRVAQNLVGWLPSDVLRLIAHTRKVPLARVIGVATFYASFYLEPRGRTVLRVCRGTACHVGGADRLVDFLAKDLGVALGETTEDLGFTLESAACLGCCSLAPVIAAGETTWGRLDGPGAVAVAADLRAAALLAAASPSSEGES